MHTIPLIVAILLIIMGLLTYFIRALNESQRTKPEENEEFEEDLLAKGRIIKVIGLSILIILLLYFLFDELL